jgi:hypothetical protein
MTLSTDNNREFDKPSTYYELARLIEFERPYENAPTLPNLLDPKLFKVAAEPLLSPATREGSERRKDEIDVFGALVRYNQQHPALIEKNEQKYSPDEFKVRNSEDADPNAILEVTLNNGEKFRITKGIRIPYQYTDVDGGTVYANILVLYNGNGHS